MRMLTFYINRAGKNLSRERHAALEKAKTILSGILADQKQKKEPATAKAAKKIPAKKSKKSSTNKTTAQKSAKKTATTTRTKKKAAKKAA
jgi:tRNA(adenine34) deaminase